MENRSRHAGDKNDAGIVVTLISFVRSTVTSIIGAIVFFQACYLMGILRAHFSDVFPTILNRNAVDITNLPFVITSISDNPGPEFYLVGVGAIILAPLLVVGFVSYVFYLTYTCKEEESKSEGLIKGR